MPLFKQLLHLWPNAWQFMILQWITRPSWCLQSQAYILCVNRIFNWIQLTACTSYSASSSKFRITGPLWEEFIGDCCIPSQMGSDAESMCMLWRVHEAGIIGSKCNLFPCIRCMDIFHISHYHFQIWYHPWTKVTPTVVIRFLFGHSN